MKGEIKIDKKFKFLLLKKCNLTLRNMGRESGIRIKTYPGSGSATLFDWNFIFWLNMKDLGLVKNMGFTSAYGFS